MSGNRPNFVRPNFIDLRSQSHGPIGNGMPSPRSLPSPRLCVAGEVPPALSPLDAFAAQSRALAKQLEESMNGDKRMSRLPPLAVEDLSSGRPNYFRSASADAGSPCCDSPSERESPAVTTEIEVPLERPVSVHPLLSGPLPPDTDLPPLPPTPASRFDYPEEEHRGRRPPIAHARSDFGARTEQSPPPLDRDSYQFRPHNYSGDLRPRGSVDSIRARAHGARRPNESALGIHGYDSRALAPPRSPYGQRNASPRSMSTSSSDDENRQNQPRVISPERQIPSALSTSPNSPALYNGRPTSVSSEYSTAGLPRPAFNFSRPISRASTNGGLPIDIPRGPSRQESSDSQPSFVLGDETANTPVSMHSEGFSDAPNENGAAPSYVYSRFNLPRGKMLQRNSYIFQDSMGQTRYSWDLPHTGNNVHPSQGNAPPSPPHPSSESTRSSTEQYTPSLSSSATIKAKSQHSMSTIDCSPEEHVSRAIAYHEAGALTKSTYHLRLAARQNHPTAMLLYALACRHGWGCRPNQKEGVAWLRKAADFAQLEIADDEETIKDGKTVDVMERKTRKAQFALSIYELGVSHMNGWGIEQDKVLALRCFEIAGSWGDADALAEAGFCYAQGVGCKKDLKKSARFYRQAEAKGISMIGNSWIYKAKYNEDPNDVASGEPRKSSETTRTQKKSRNGLFGRKKSTG
ncbi:hypothetical protein HYFRA_00008017 [Hymenoscyphus fraxineus]|uniref:HCP-like protein n=1 Tax=Hymenoscyphus fraxineus TaxID=746836 RepID=A0A9N9KR93_9HELO|nr:hypothetical protein HYFRA_00008017 [Hymenoscyphus fraxineus]